jgi:hypothetical protein
MNDPIYSGPDYPRQVYQTQRSGWSIVLIFACVALGFTASAADFERIVASRERNEAELLATECSTAEGKLEDLGKYLADPNTRLISLTRSGEYAARPAVIAWNSPQRQGYFLCDDLPVLDAGEGYELWALSGSDDPVKVATIDARPGDSVYPFRIWQTTAGKLRLEITAGSRSQEKSPVFAGEIE